MRWAIYLFLMGIILAVSVVFWAYNPISQEAHTVNPPMPQVADAYTVDEPIQPILPPSGLDPKKVKLGRQLFHDPRLSKDGSIACATCHDLSRGGTDHLVQPVGVDGVRGDVNTLTVFNSSNNFRFLWDGRIRTLEEQMHVAVTSPEEMSATWPDVVRRLKKASDYAAGFRELYGAGISEQTIVDALASFMRSLVTPDSRFDQYLLGNENAITEDEKRGYELFKSYGCISCHQGVNVGGNMFQTFGVMEDYFADRGRTIKADLGRFNVTGREQDKYKFRVPTLRNVELTAPYFHDGTATSLPAAVNVMAKYQLGRNLPERDVADIVKFLKTLTGNHKEWWP